MRFRAAEVQARLVCALKERGVVCRAEVSLPAHSPLSRSRWFRADVVAYRDGDMVVAVECKGYSGPPRGKRQRENYEKCGVPALWCGAEDIERVADQVRLLTFANNRE
jgi:hypothetical protein